MSEFELSTLAVLALLLFAIGAYSYWQIHRAQKAQEAHKTRLAEQAVEPPSQHRYPTYAPEQEEPLPENWPSAPAAVHSEPVPELAHSSAPDEGTELAAQEAASEINELAQSREPATQEQTAQSAAAVESKLSELEVEINDQVSAQVNAEVSAEVNAATNTDAMVAISEAEQQLEVARVQNAIAQMTVGQPSASSEPSASSNEAASFTVPEESVSDAVTEAVTDAIPESSASEQSSPNAALAPFATEPLTHSETAPPMSTPAERLSVMVAEPAHSKNAPLRFDVDEAVEKERIAQRITAHEIKRRATWEVFAPFARFEHWLHTAHPHGVDPIRAIDAEIVIAVNQPKTAEDIERALYDLRLDTPLPLQLLGARAGQISLESGGKKHWQELQAGAPYCAIKLSLQLANRSVYAQEELIQRWFALAEALRKRLAGHIETLPNAYELSEYAQFLHALARRVGQPIILQLHKDNGLWPAYEVHQQLTACGATLLERGIYVTRNERNTPVYAVMNDVNNPRAQDFFRSQLAVMYVHTLSFCVELARIELRLEDAAQELEPIQRLLSDMKTVAQALGAQWQNHVGEEISLDELEKIAHEQTRIFARQLNALGLPVGARMTKRLLLG